MNYLLILLIKKFLGLVKMTSSSKGLNITKSHKNDKHNHTYMYLHERT